MDGYWATSVKVWDVAAGMLVVQEAGGTISGMEGSPGKLSRPEMLASASPELQRELLSVLQEAAAESPRSR
jgi:myo-inositol-1(or 4)-monophosphatase